MKPHLPIVELLWFLGLLLAGAAAFFAYGYLFVLSDHSKGIALFFSIAYGTGAALTLASAALSTTPADR